MIGRVLRIQPSDNHADAPKHVAYFAKKTLENFLSVKNEDEINKRRQKLQYIFKTSQSIVFGDPVDVYLRNRGISLPNYPSSLRFHQSIPYYENKKLVAKFPAMLAVVMDSNNQGVTIHRTYLDNGYKADVAAPKKLMSPVGSISGAAIKFFVPHEGKLVIAEGIETALSFHIATGFPVWAAVSASGMEKIILPQSVIDVLIAVDNDKSGRGQEAASVLAKRLLSEGRTVRRVMPSQVGQDFNDILLRVTL